MTLLPPDAPDAFIHAHVRDGGLGVLELSVKITLMRFERASRILTTDFLPVRALAGSPYVRYLLHASQPVTRGGVRLDSKAAIRRHHRDTLLRIVDGRGLEASSNVPYVHDWLLSPKPPLQGSHWVGAVKVRGNLLHTAQRAARASSEKKNRLATCDAGCGRPETLGHISQVCHRTADPRTARHNQVLDLGMKFLTDIGGTRLLKSLPSQPLKASDVLIS